MGKYWRISGRRGRRKAGSDKLWKKGADRKYYNKHESWERAYRKKKREEEEVF